MKKSLIILTGILLLAFTTADIRSMYKVPREAASVCAADIDMDGDNDLIIGHKTAWGNTNPTITILNNSYFGNFEIFDTSLVFSGYQENIFAVRINDDTYPDIVSFYTDFSSGTAERFIRIFINDAGAFINNMDINLNESSVFSGITYGDVNGNNFQDIILLSNSSKTWGLLTNDGFGNFNSPEYYNLGYYPQDIVTGDLNNDGTDDIVIGGSTEIYFSKDGGFQNLQLGGHTSRVHIADIDNDGDNDIIGLFDLLGAETDITIFENTGLETFVKHDIDHFLPGSTSSVVTDFNNDTLPDLMVLPASNNGAFILYNASGLEFYEPEFIEIPNDGEAYRRATTADLDGNGFNDIVLVRRTGPNAATYNNVIILFNDGKGHFVDNPLDFVDNHDDNEGLKLMNYPNPFKTVTTFDFTIKETAYIEIFVYNLQGKLVKSLTNKTMKGGKHQIKWGGLNNAGQACKPGPYIAYLKVNGFFKQSIKLIHY